MVHFHTIIPDGVFVPAGDGPARYFPIAQPRDEEVEAILARVVRRTAKILAGHDEDLASEEDALAALQAAEVERRLRHPEPFEGRRRGAFLQGFSLHAGVRIHARDRDGRERLCRYILRSRVVPDPVEEPATPQPQESLPARAAAGEPRAATRLATELADTDAHSEPPALRSYRVPWAALLRKVFDVDVLLACPQCGGRLRLIAFIAEPAVARKILDHLGLDSTGPPTTPRRPEHADPVEPGPAHDVADPVHEEE